ncbi:MAG: hypothetical protein ACI8WM_003437 [Burkholderiaceae bacterium]|jgi:hypothetical protein
MFYADLESAFFIGGVVIGHDSPHMSAQCTIDDRRIRASDRHVHRSITGKIEDA